MSKKILITVALIAVCCVGVKSEESAGRLFAGLDLKALKLEVPAAPALLLALQDGRKEIVKNYEAISSLWKEKTKALSKEDMKQWWVGTCASPKGIWREVMAASVREIPGDGDLAQGYWILKKIVFYSPLDALDAKGNLGGLDIRAIHDELESNPPIVWPDNGITEEGWRFKKGGLDIRLAKSMAKEDTLIAQVSPESTPGFTTFCYYKKGIKP